MVRPSLLLSVCLPACWSPYRAWRKLAGAGFLYCSCKAPQATASVFVYPAGRVGQSQSSAARAILSAPD